MKDPLFEQIQHRLTGELDPRVFEDCAVALLQEEYGTLVPIRGGSDSGMDGAIADGEGEAYPLVVTTGEQVGRNLKNNLDSYLASGGGRRRAVLATSQFLTPPARQKLLALARGEGFTLVQIHAGEDFAMRLYRNSAWLKQLLGLTGTPRALSAVPLNRRPLRELELVGRDEDLRWLRETRDDRLLVGQPGSGKTYLLHELVKDGSAFFLVDQNAERLAADLRELEPKIVVIDDAHLAREFLDRLRQMRADLGAEFEIVAATWPGAESAVTAALGGLDDQHVRRLELLTLGEIIEIFHQIGVDLPEDHSDLRVLVDQASNRPGLAVVLGDLWLRGHQLHVATGQALRGLLLPALQQVLGSDPTFLLACFALGGDRGLPGEVVRRYIESDREDFWRRLTESSQGGVLAQSEECFVVLPQALRYPLIEDVFFSRTHANYRPLLEGAPEPAAVVETLSRAALLGVAVPGGELQLLLEQHGEPTAWRAYTGSGPQQARWVLDEYPGDLADIPELLHMLPREAVARFLLEVIRSEIDLDVSSRRAYRLLQNWVEELSESGGELGKALERRRVLAEVAGGLAVADREEVQRLQHAALLALSPRLARNRMSARGDRLVWREGHLPPEAVPEILELWQRLEPLFSEVSPQTWMSLRDAIRSWTHPPSLGANESPEALESMREVARRIVAFVAQHQGVELGLARELRRLATALDMQLDLPEDELFDVLFPLPPATRDYRQETARQEARATESAREWAKRDPAQAAMHLGRLNTEARRWGIHSSSALWTFYETLAEAVATPRSWLEAFLDHRVDARGVYHLLARVLTTAEGDWEALVRQCLETADYHSAAVELVLRSSTATGELLDLALHEPEVHVVDRVVPRGVPVEVVRRLLRHPSGEVARAALVGEWLADEEGQVRDEIAQEWRGAVLSVSPEEVRGGDPTVRHWFGAILHRQPHLAFDWLLRYVEAANESGEALLRDHVVELAAAALDGRRRSELLLALQPNHTARTLLPLLVHKSPDVYREVLGSPHLRAVQLTPLAGGPPDEAWEPLARLALGAGHDARDVATESFQDAGAYSGWGIEFWGRWETAFRKLAESPDAGLHEVARHGLEIAQARMARARKEQRQFEITGRFF